MIRKYCLLFFIINFIIQSGYSQEKILLQYKPGKGVSFISEYNVQTSIRQEIMGIDQQIDMNMIMVTQSRVEEVLDTAVLLSMKYERLVIETITPMGRIEMDTDSDMEQPGIEYLRLMTGKPFEVIINPEGKVVDITGLEKIISDISSEIRENNPAVQAYKGTLNEAFGEENIKSNLEITSHTYPTYEVGTGESWSYQMETVTAQMSFQIHSTSTVKEIHPDRVLIQTHSLISTPGKTRMKIEGMDASMSMTGKQVSEIYVDPNTGLPLRGIIQQDIKGEIILDMQEEGMGEMKIPMIIDTRTELDVKNVNNN